MIIETDLLDILSFIRRSNNIDIIIIS